MAGYVSAKDIEGLDLEALDVILSIEEPRMPQGLCAIFIKKELVYFGPIAGSDMRAGAQVLLNPVDAASLDAFMRSMLH